MGKYFSGVVFSFLFLFSLSLNSQALVFNSGEPYIISARGSFNSDFNLVSNNPSGSPGTYSVQATTTKSTTSDYDTSGIDYLQSLDFDRTIGLPDEKVEWIYDSIFNLAIIQFGLVGKDADEFGRVLREDFLFYHPERPEFETADVYRHLQVSEDDDLFEFDVGNYNTARDLYLSLDEGFWVPEGEWGIEELRLHRRLKEDKSVREELVFSFNYDSDTVTYRKILRDMTTGDIIENHIIHTFQKGDGEPVD